MRAPRANPLGYNPAEDGFPAKAWECLRRNKAFYDDLNLSHAKSEEDALSLAEDFKAHMQSNSFYRAIYSPLVEWSWGDPDEKEDWYHLTRCLDLGTAWPKIHPDTRDLIEDSLSPHEALNFETPNFEEIDPYKKNFSDAKAKKFLSELANSLETHRLILLPATVWDRQHKGRILAEVSEILGNPMAKDARWLKNSGRALGSEAEWRSFLLVEQWRNPRCGNYGPGMAANLAAWEIYGGEDFGEEPKVRLGAARAFLKHCEKFQKHAATVEKHVRLIEKAVSSVYPVFDPRMGTLR